MAFLQIEPAFGRFNIRFGRLLLLTCFLVLVNIYAVNAQVRAVRITFNTDAGNQALAGWNSQAYQSFSGNGTGCLTAASGPSELHFWGWGTSSSQLSTDVEHVAGSSGSNRPDYTRFDSIAPGVYVLEMDFNTFFGDPTFLPKTPATCLTGTPSLLMYGDTLYSIAFKVRGDSVSTAFINAQCGAIPDCDCNPICLNNIATAAYNEPATGGYYIIRNLHTNNPTLVDSFGNPVFNNQVSIEVIEAHDLQLSALGHPDSQYYARPILHARPLELTVLAENNGYDHIKGIEVKANVYDPQNRLVFTSTASINELDPFQATYTGKTAREQKVLIFPQTFLPQTTGRYRIEYVGTSVSMDTQQLNNRVIQYIEITDSTFARDNGQHDGSHLLPTNIPFPTVGAIGQRFQLDKMDSLTSITVAMDITNHAIILGYPTINAALYTWDSFTQKPGALVDTSFSYQLTTDDVGKIFTKTFSLSKGPQKLFAGKYVIVIHQYGAAYQIPFLYSQSIYEPGTIWETSGTYLPLANSWQEVTSFQGAFHLRPNFGNTYCTSTATDSLGAAIQQVLLAGESITLNHLSSGYGGVYSSFQAQAADLIPDKSYSLQVVLSDSGSGPFVDRRIAGFVDWNGDFDFEDPGESIGEVGPIWGGMPAPINTLTFQVPANATTGTKRLRLVCVEGAAAGSILPCQTYTRGETEDYVIQVIPFVPADGEYCDAAALLYDDLIITKVTIIGEQSSINIAINNPEVGSRYSNFTSQQVTLFRNNNYNLSVNINDAQGNYQNNDKNRGFKVFIDWDQNGEFDPISELAASALRFNFNGAGPINMTIRVPSTAEAGKTRMRIIAQRTSGLANISPCGFFDKGEVEDYTVVIPSNQVKFNALPLLNNPAYYIESVSLPGDNISIQKSSTCSSTSPAPVYQDFRNNLADLTPGNTYGMTVVFDSCSFSSSLDSGKVFVYADWNNDGDIEDFNETLYESPFVDGINPNFDFKGKDIPITFQIPLGISPGFLSLFVEVASVGANGKVTHEAEEYTLIIRAPRDVGISQISTDSEACGLAQTIFSVDICNLGQETLYQIPVDVTFGGYHYALTFSDTLPPKNCGRLIIDTIDTRGGGIWNITAQTLLSGDTDPSNNLKNLSVSFGEIPNLDVDTINLCRLDTAFLPNPSEKVTYYWYDSVRGGTPIDTGAFFVPNSLSQLTTYFVQAEAFSYDSLDSWYPDSTGYFAEVGQQGNIVDVTAKTSLSIDAFDLNLFIPAGDDTVVTIYVKSGTYHGFERDPFAWQQLGAFSITSNGQDNKTRLTLPNPISLAAGQTIGLYIIGPLTNAIFLPFDGKDFVTEKNNDLITESGLTNCSTVPESVGCLFGIRYWSSVIHYTKGCASDRVPITLTFDQLPPTALCQTATLVLDASGMASLAASQIDAGSADNCTLSSITISPNTFSCAEVGVNNISLTATDSRSNSSSCQASILIKDPFEPIAQCQSTTLSLDANGNVTLPAVLVDAGSSDNCSISSFSVTPSNFGCVDIGTSAFTLAVTDTDANTATCQAMVTIQDNLPPDAICQDISLALDAAGNASLAASQVDGGTLDNCTPVSLSISQNALSCTELGLNSVTLTTSDIFGNSSMCQAVVTVVDAIPPNALCQPITLFFDVNGDASLSANQVDAGSNDNCSVDTVTLNQTAFTCATLGSHAIILTATDQSGNDASCQVLVTLIDSFAPVMSCQDVTLSLDANGSAVLTPSQLDNGSADFCGIQSFSLSNNTFTCSDLGSVPVTLSGEDGSGNAASCQAQVTIVDDTAPDALCQAVTLSLDATGNASLAVSQIDAGSSDNCGINTITLSQNSFSCTQTGVNTLTLRVSDATGNRNTCQAQIFVFEPILPTALCQPVTLFLDATGSASLTPAQVDAGSNDNCGIDTLIVSQDLFDCNSLGTNTITLTAADASNNSNICQAVIQVQDTLSPTMACQPVTLSLDAQGIATLVSSQSDNGSFDACGFNSLTLSQSRFTCLDIGIITVSLMGEDNSGNTASCQTMVTVQDAMTPSAICQPVTLTLDAAGNASLAVSQIDAGSSDNCGINAITISQNSFTCTQTGVNTLTLSVSDAVGNTNACQAQVFVFEPIPPTVLCQPVTLFLDATGSASLTPAQVDAGSNDNCGIDTLRVSQDLFDCNSLGTNTITLTAADASNNRNICQAVIQVQDTLSPTMACQPVTLSLDAQGIATLVSSQADNGSFDACGFNSLTLSQSRFTCLDIGIITVSFMGEDNSGNTASCQAMVTVQDAIAPSAICQPVTLLLDAAGNASLAVSQVDAGSSDNCVINAITISQNSFTCTQTGVNTLTLSVSDATGNSSSCQAQVFVFEPIPPTALCQPVTLFLDATGSATLDVAQVDAGSNDNCVIDTLTLSQTSFSCLDVGINPVILSVTDLSTNSTTCQALVHIIDSLAPSMSCQNVVLTLDGSGVANLRTNQLDAGSADVCGIQALVLSKSSFDCNDIGTNLTRLIAVDSSGNTALCQAFVTVRDTTPPLAACQGLTLALDANGNTNLTVNQVDVGSSDNCSIPSSSLSKNSFSCDDIGIHTVTLTTTDGSNNTDNCQAQIWIVDDLFPLALCQPVTVLLDANGSALVSTNQVDAGSNDNCTIDSYTLSQPGFACSDLGIQTVTLTVTDPSANSASCQAAVDVQDALAPTMGCQSVTLSLNANGAATLNTTQIDNGSSDACSIQSFTISQSAFTCSDIGNQNITLTAQDISGNSANCQANITIQDNTDPSAICQTVVLSLDANGMATLNTNQVDLGSNDNCGITNYTLSQSSFTCNDLGTNTVTLTITDGSGNNDACQAQVQVADVAAPTPLCQPITLSLDPFGAAGLTPAQINGGSQDNCTINSLMLSQTLFDCSHLGANAISLTVIDASNNRATCQAIVTIVDVFPPVMSCQNITFPLGANGTATLIATQVVGGSIDNCGIDSFDVRPSLFTCGDIGNNSVTLRAFDASGNLDSCQAQVTVQDVLPPQMGCQASVTLVLNTAGVANLTVNQVNVGSADNCMLASLALSQTVFDSLDTYSIYLKGVDIFGNEDSCLTIVTVQDTAAPIMICQSVILDLDALGVATLAVNDVDNGSSDRTGNLSLSIDKSNFNCTDVGINQVTLTGVGTNQQTAFCLANVTVRDTIDPSIGCQAVSLTLDNQGLATVTPAQVNTGSLDNCGPVTLTLSKNSFTCSDINANLVTLSSMDVNGNIATCTANITVSDLTPPFVSCQPVTLSLNAFGNANLMVNQIDNGSSDNCGIAFSGVDKNTFTCTDLGSNPVRLAVVDNNAINATCQTSVFVQDTLRPIMACQAITLSLDASGNVLLSPTQVDRGSVDNCAINSLSVDKTSFDCSDIGPQTIILTGSDISTNTASCTTQIWVQDSTAPIMACLALDLYLDANGSVSVSAAQIDGGSNDICGIASVGINNGNFDCSHIGSNAITLTATDVNGNDASCIANIMVFDTLAPVMVCQDITISLDNTSTITLSGTDLNAGSNDNCITFLLTLSQSVFTFNQAGVNAVSLIGTDVQNNAASCISQVTVLDTTPPTMICQSATLALDPGGIATLLPSQIDNGSNDLYGITSFVLSEDMFSCMHIGANLVTLTGTNPNGYSASCQATVQIIDNLPPAMNCQPVNVDLDAQGTGTLTSAEVDGGSLDNCGIVSFSINRTLFSCSDINQSITVTLTATDAEGNSDNCTSAVTVRDLLGPDMNCRTAILPLDANGNANLTTAQINNGSTDNCGISLLALSKSNFNCANNGINPVTLIAIDNHGNSSTCQTFVFVQDLSPPTMTCQDITVSLDANGQASLTANQVDAGSLDNCGITSLTINQNSFDCTHIGQQIITLEGIDGSMNNADCQANVTIQDTIPPTANCVQTTLSLDSNGEAILTINQFNTGSNDICGIASTTISQDSFTCSHIGPNNIALTVTDVNGNSAICQANVQVEDVLDPTIRCQPVTLYLDSTGTASLASSQVDAGSSDNCGILLLGISQSQFGVLDLGQNNISLTGTDNNGNPASCISVVTVLDTFPPSMKCQDVTLYLDQNGSAVLSANQIDAGSSDPVGITSLTIDKSQFSCLDKGPNTVVLTATNAINLTASCQATVTVIDTLLPVVGCQNITLALDMNGMANLFIGQINVGSQDNCGIQQLSLSQTSFDCSDAGTQAVTLMATDESGNMASCSSLVTISDFQSPTISCLSPTLYLDATGEVLLSLNQIDGGSSDNCGIVNWEISQDTFSCNDIGQRLVSLTAEDGTGNKTICQASITVQDSLAPAMNCKTATLILDANAMASLSINQVDAGTTDNCGIDTVYVSKDQFGVADVGQNQVTLTAIDIYGNIDSCLTIVNVQDSTAPNMVCLNVILALDATGNTSLAVSHIDGGSSDIAGFVSLTISNNSFDCLDIGKTLVSLTGTNSRGISASCQAQVTIIDPIAPIMACQPVSLNLDSNGQASLSTNQVDAGSSDNCAMNSLRLSQDSFTCADIGQLTLTLTGTDESGNTATCQANLSLQDVIAPNMSCQTVILPLDSSGNATLNTSQIDRGSIDNCGISTYTLSQNQFSCTDIGQNVITLTGSDASNNHATCQAVVIVQDNMTPVMSCQQVSLSLDANGNSSLTVSQIDSGSSDNCGINNLTLSKLIFGCGDVGANMVTLSAIDTQGNIDSCQATVTVGDNSLPTVTCQSPTLYLDQNGQSSLTTAQVDAGSLDNCGIAALAISQQNFNCTHIGQRLVSLTATDVHGNIASCQANVSVLDTLPPSITCQSLTLILDSLGNASLSVSQVNAGSNDNCGIDTTSLSQTTFTIVDLGQNTVILSTTDVNRNTTSCSAIITIQDLSLPTMSCRNAVLQLDANGDASLAASHIDAGSSDSQGLVSLAASPNNFTCADLGQRIVTLTGTNIAGNRASCFAILGIQDTISPQLSCQSAVLSLNASGNANLPVAFINAGSGDNCQITSFILSKTSFGCNDIGFNTVTLTGTDDAGNSTSCSTTVQVRDPVAPNSLCKPATLYLNTSGLAALTTPQIDAGSNDNCSISILALSKSNFDCTDVGGNMVTLVTIDGSGNSSTCQEAVTVSDTLPPVVQCQPVTLTLDANSIVTLHSGQINAGATDNCSIDSLRVSQRSFTTTHVGQNMVYLAAVDIFGNQDSCVAQVTVRDTTGPAMQCQSIILSLNAQGTVSLSPTQIDGGSSDQYGQVTLTVSPNVFSCISKGTNTVTLTGVNVNGVPASCQTNVTIQDILPPTMLCQNATLGLGATGTATLTPNLVDAGSMDNCGIASKVVSQIIFDCTDIGSNMVTFAGSDSSSNFSSCQAFVTVIDTTLPTASCQNLTLPLDANGIAILSAAQVDAGSADNCNLVMAISNSTFGCPDIGSQTVILAVTDAGFNSASCQANILIQDTTPPTISCQQVLLQLGPQGYSILTINQVDAGSSDNCSIQSLVLSKDSFVCADIGTQLITLTATDAESNQSSCQSTVRITDSSAPDMQCQDTTVFIDANGQGRLTTAMVDAGSSDNCGIATLFVGRTNFDCSDIGMHSVALAGIDGSGNSDGCVATVTVADTIPPLALCEPALLILNANGHASLALAQINAGSADNCGLQSLTLNKSTFTCIDAGIQMVTLTAVDSSGNQHSCTTSVTVQDTTAAPFIQTIGDTTFCEGDQVTLKTKPGSLAYDWTDGRSDSLIVVTISDTLRVRVSYAPGCWTPFSSPQIVRVDPAIPMPQILQVGMDSLRCSIPNGDTYTWFRNDTLLSVSDRTIFAPQNGAYKVFVERGLCTSDTSVIYLINTALDDPISSAILELYPNPNRGIFFLRGDFGTSSLVEINIFSFDGKLVFEKEAFAPQGKLDELLSLKDVADGVYMVRVRVNNEFYWKKVEVVR